MNLKLLKEYIYIPKKERTISFLLLLTINAGIATYYFFIFEPIPAEISISKSKSDLDIQNYEDEKTAPLNVKVKGNKLDVNSMTQSDWQNEGFSEKQAKMIVSYKSRIKEFQNAKDLEAVYCISSEYIGKNKHRFVFSKLNTIEQENGQIKDNQIVAVVPAMKIELNSCDLNQLQSIYGIGEKLSSRIIKYRELLGGFVKVEQLKEIYGLREETFTAIESFVEVRTKVKRININSADFATLIKHPYLDKSRVVSIINYRKSHGNYTTIEEIKNIYSISDSIFVKVKPYITVENE